jgi:hypothetical protein
LNTEFLKLVKECVHLAARLLNGLKIEDVSEYIDLGNHIEKASLLSKDAIQIRNLHLTLSSSLREIRQAKRHKSDSLDASLTPRDLWG